MRTIYFDMEASGLWSEEGHRLVEIGAIEAINGHMTDNHFHSYLNPQRPMDDEVIAIHGLTNEFLADKPLFGDIAAEFREFIGDSPVYITCRVAPDGRNPDTAMTNFELSDAGQAIIPLSQWVNIRPWGEKMYGYQEASLNKMLDRYQINRDIRNERHGALIDAHLLGLLTSKVQQDYQHLAAKGFKPTP